MHDFVVQCLICCRLGHSDVFDLIHQHDLFASVSDRVVMLMEFDSSAAVKMLLDNTDKIPVCGQQVIKSYLVVLHAWH